MEPTKEPQEQPQDPLEIPPVVRITPDEVAKAVPPPPQPGRPMQLPIPPTPKPRRSKLATTSLVLGILGMLLCLPSAFAILIGSLALGAMHGNTLLYGRKRAVIGLALGILAVIVWPLVGFFLYDPDQPGRPTRPPAILDVAGGGPPEGLHDSDEPYRSSLLANVVVLGSTFGAQWSGAGVVIDRDGPTLRILTNRHVAQAPGITGGSGELEVMLSSGERAEAKTVWMAPEGVDLAALEVVAATAKDVPVIAVTRTRATVGQAVFAVGNPLEYRWTLTKGNISSVRTVTKKGERVKIYQTQTPISSGNSGGGLYTEESGSLVGVNTWSADKRVSEGLSFSISTETLLDLLEKSQLDWAVRIVKAAGNP